MGDGLPRLILLIAILIGFAFGFVGSAPIAGPISVIVLARSLNARYRSALLVGMGAAIAESVYAVVAFWGFAELLANHTWVEPLSRGAGALILLGLGLSFLLRKPSPDQPETPRRAGAGSFFAGLTVNALNPTLIATWTGAVATLRGTGAVDVEGELAIPFGLAVGLGIACWYVVLVSLVRRFRDRFRKETLDRVLRVFGVFVMGIGVWFAVRFITWF